MNIKRITRLLQLLKLLQSGSGTDANGLANACGVGKRTVFRDLEALKMAGVPLAFDKDEKRYSIPGSFFLPPLNFTANEALSLVALAAELGIPEPGRDKEVVIRFKPMVARNVAEVVRHSPNKRRRCPMARWSSASGCRACAKSPGGSSATATRPRCSSRPRYEK
jgi:hypothetical protein